MKFKTGFFFILILFFAFPALAQPTPDSTKMELPIKRKKFGFTPFPAVFITPETGFGYGLLGVGVFNFGKDSLTRNSNVQLLGYLTTKKQSSLQFSYLVFSNREAYIFSGENNFFDFTIFYYGVGNKTPEADESLISYKYVTTQNRILKKVKGHFYAGGQLQVNRVWNIDYDSLTNKTGISRLNERPAKELETNTVSGFGPSLLYDKRDNVLNPSTGLYLDFGAHFNHRIFGSDFNFTRYSVDARKYYHLHDKHILAFQGRGVFNSGNAPFRELANLGGKYIMRGFYEGRFRDKHMAAVQAEYRWQGFSRIGFVAFGSAGQVSSAMKNFGLGQTKLAGGGGVRLMINRKDRLNVRIDYAVGTGGASGIYFSLGEAF